MSGGASPSRARTSVRGVRSRLRNLHDKTRDYLHVTVNPFGGSLVSSHGHPSAEISLHVVQVEPSEQPGANFTQLPEAPFSRQYSTSRLHPPETPGHLNLSTPEQAAPVGSTSSPSFAAAQAFATVVPSHAQLDFPAVSVQGCAASTHTPIPPP